MAVDLYSGFGSVSGSNNFRVDHSPLDQSSFAPGPLDLGDLIDPLEALIEFVEELTGLDISSPEKFLASLLALLGDLGTTIASLVQYLMDQTGLVFDEGPIAFVISLIQAIVDNIGKVIEAIVANIGAIITAICKEFPIVWDKGPQAFIESIIAALDKLGANVQALIDNFLTLAFQLFGLDFQSVQAFFASIIDGVVANIQFVIDGLISNTQAIFAAIGAAFPVVWDQGPQAFIDSIVAILNTIGANTQALIDNFLNMTFQLFGLDFASLEAFFSSVVSSIFGQTGLNLAGPVEFIDSVWEILLGMIQGIFATVDSVAQTIGQALGFPNAVQSVQDLTDWVGEEIFGGIASAFGITSAYIGSGSNIVPNPNFESLDFYGSANFSTEQKRSGTRSLKLTTRTAAKNQYFVVCDNVGAKPLQTAEGDVFYCEFWVWGAAANVGGGTVQMEFQPVNGAGANLAAQVVSLAATAALRSKWTKVSGKVTMPAGTTSAKVAVQTAASTNATDVYWFDDIVVREITAVNALELVAQTAQQVSTAVSSGLTGMLATATGVVGATAATLANMIKNLNQLGQFNVAGLLGIIPMTQVDGPGDFTNIGAAMQDTWDKLFAALTGITPTTVVTPALTADQVALLMGTAANHATRLAKLEADEQNKLTNFLAVQDEFERAVLNPLTNAQGVPVPPLWREFKQVATGAGGFSLNAGQMRWTDAGTATNLVRYLRINPADWKTETEFQKVTRVTGTAIAEFGIPLIAGPAEDYIYARVNDDMSKYVFVMYDGDSNARLGWTTTGVAGQQWLSPLTKVSAPPSAGAIYELMCGDASDPYSYTLIRNGTAIFSFAAPQTKPLVDDLKCRGWGWGGRAVTRGVGQSSPSWVHSVSVIDAPPNPTIGSYLLAVRNTTTPISKPASVNILPNNTINDVRRNSPDILFDEITNILVLTKPGPYTINLRIDTGTDIAVNEEWEVQIYEVGTGANGTDKLIQRAGQTGAPLALVGAATTNACDGVFQIYNDKPSTQYRFGFKTTAIEQVVGDAAGTTTYLTVTRGS